jgi:HlyD family secretion protein
MTNSPDLKTDMQKWSAKTPMLVGIVAMVTLILGIGVWGSFTKIAGAIVASGTIQVESLRQVVQHPDGGVVGEILARDGQRVEAGDILLRFDDKLLKSQSIILDGQLSEFAGRKARMRAERDGDTELQFDTIFAERAPTDPNLQKVLATQTSLFSARLQTFKQTQEQLIERQTQIRLQIEGSQKQVKSLELQLALLSKERADQEVLLKKGLAQASRVLALQREEARLLGQRGELEASIAASGAQIIETKLEALRLASQRREQAETDLQDIETSEIELNERLISATETLERLDVRAPVSGIVYDMQVHALRSVVRPADPMLYIIPQDQPLVVQSRIETIHIDQVTVGQAASLRFSTFDQRTTPEIFGTVSKVSADVFTDEVTGVQFYTAELLPNAGEIERLGDIELLPGMPVEAFIKTGDRTPLNYLLKPFMDYLNRAFRE